MSTPGTRHADDASAGNRRTSYLWWLIWLLWLPFFIPVFVAFFRTHPGPLRLATGVAGSLAFFALYIWMGRRNALRLASPVPCDPPRGAASWVPAAAIAGLATGLIVLNGQPWGGLFIFTSACLGGWLPLRQAVAVIALLAAIAGISVATGGSLAQYVNSAAFIVVPGLTVVATVRSVATSQRLRAEREALQRQAAVSEERLRIARDLHDLLGHSLARMALESEVAESLVVASPDQAAEAMRGVGDAARRALREVRAAVAGYRQPTLAGELRAAREILTAAGIDLSIDGDPLVVPAADEPPLAWAVREGVTNAVKHSHARHCAIRFAVDGVRARLEVADDGPRDVASGAAAAGEVGGSGLAGLAERLAAVGGSVEAGPTPGGGFSLSVDVPLGRTPAENGSRDPALRPG